MITTSVAEAAACLKQGQVLAYPTEAVWGLGCDPFNERAFREILSLKQRPVEKGVILLAAHIAQVEHLLAALSQAQRAENWPVTEVYQQRGRLDVVFRSLTAPVARVA
mgnify:CR=1 FL=1